jgi:peptidoglycan/LPS O-acetylase OafA/YrhL
MSTRMVRATAVIALIGCAVLVLHGLWLGVYFEPTDGALERAQKGQEVGYPAALGGVLAFVALLGSRRRWAAVPAVLGLVLGLIALVIDLTR